MKKRILAYLKSTEEECSQCRIYKEVVGRRDAIARALSALCDEGSILCVGDGVRADPRRYVLNPRKRTESVQWQERRSLSIQNQSCTNNVEIFI
jgi:hypothetical protein